MRREPMLVLSVSLKIIFLSNTINSPTQHKHIKWNISRLRSMLAWSVELPWSGSYQFKKHCGRITLIRSLLILHLALKPLNNNSWNKYLWWNVNVTSKLYQIPSHPNIIVSQKHTFSFTCIGRDLFWMTNGYYKIPDTVVSLRYKLAHERREIHMALLFPPL